MTLFSGNFFLYSQRLYVYTKKIGKALGYHECIYISKKKCVELHLTYTQCLNFVKHLIIFALCFGYLVFVYAVYVVGLSKI